MSDEERIEQLELEVKVLRDNNKGLKDKIDEQFKEIECLNIIHESYKEMVEENNFISKDKIKAKIEEYDDKGMTKYLGTRSYGKTFQQVLREEIIKVLQSLLEKE